MTLDSWKHLASLLTEAAERAAADRHTAISKPGHDSGLLRKTSRTTLAKGDVVLGRFKILRWLGSGGMGEVYEAFDYELAHVIALKLIRPEIAGNDHLFAQFEREVQIARLVSAATICRIHELFVFKDPRGANKSALMTMEFLEGITLADALRRGPLRHSEARSIALDICQALTTMHAAGIVHRDLKTRNIMLLDCDGRRRAVVMDFGPAYEVCTISGNADTALAAPGEFLGPSACRAPEQFQGGPITASTDIYALGVVLHELARGKRPAGRLLDVPAAHRWDAVVQRCLRFGPADRYQSAAEVARALRLSELKPPIFRRRFHS
ncbi:serine/threonine protein kinase [Acidobacteria bacterium AB60]|nr:serine/threonine protein kinase [Acidobacteria bacterium AB60]